MYYRFWISTAISIMFFPERYDNLITTTFESIKEQNLSFVNEIYQLYELILENHDKEVTIDSICTSFNNESQTYFLCNLNWSNLIEKLKESARILESNRNKLQVI